MIFNNSFFDPIRANWDDTKVQSWVQKQINQAMAQPLLNIGNICDLVFGILIQYCPHPGGSDYAAAQRPGWRNPYSTGALVSSIHYEILDNYTFEFTIGDAASPYAAMTNDRIMTGKTSFNPNYHWANAATEQAKKIILENYGGAQIDLTV